MRKLVKIAAAAAFVATQAQAADWQSGPGEARAGAFIGARLKMSLGRGESAQPQAALMVAPTRAYRLTSGRIATQIGEGVALDFAARTPTLSLGGVPADVALGLRRQGDAEPGRKLGISTIGWVAIGGVAAVGVVLLVANFTCVGEDEDFCGSD